MTALPSALPLVAAMTLPTKKPASFCLAVPVAGPLPRVGGDDLVDDAGQGVGAQGLEAPGPGDLGRVAAAGQHLGQHLLGLGGGERGRRPPCAGRR